MILAAAMNPCPCGFFGEESGRCTCPPQVVARYVFNAPTLWGFEVGYMLTGAAFLLGLSYSLRQDGHIRVDFVTIAIGPRGKAVVDVVGYLLLMIPLAGWMVWFLTRQAL